MFTNDETIEIVRRKIDAAGLQSESNRDVVGSMNCLVADHQGMKAYVRAYRCEKTQAVIANLMAALSMAISTAESHGLDCESLRLEMTKARKVLDGEIPF